MPEKSPTISFNNGSGMFCPVNNPIIYINFSEPVKDVYVKLVGTSGKETLEAFEKAMTK